MSEFKTNSAYVDTWERCVRACGSSYYDIIFAENVEVRIVSSDTSSDRRVKNGYKTEFEIKMQGGPWKRVWHSSMVELHFIKYKKRHVYVDNRVLYEAKNKIEGENS